MIKNISIYSPIIGLLLLVIALLFDSTNIFYESYSYKHGNRYGGDGMHQGFRFIFGLCLYTPLVILYLISIIRLIKNPKVFDGSISWTIIHLLPILLFVYVGLTSLEKKIHSYKNKNQYIKLAKHERYFTDSSDSTRYLIFKQNFVFYVIDRQRSLPNRPPYVEAVGKINNQTFESIYNKEKFSSSRGLNLQKMKNKKGDTFFALYKYNQIPYDEDTYIYPEDYYPSFFKLK